MAVPFLLGGHGRSGAPFTSSTNASMRIRPEAGRIRGLPPLFGPRAACGPRTRRSSPPPASTAAAACPPRCVSGRAGGSYACVAFGWESDEHADSHPTRCPRPTVWTSSRSSRPRPGCRWSAAPRRAADYWGEFRASGLGPMQVVVMDIMPITVRRTPDADLPGRPGHAQDAAGLRRRLVRGRPGRPRRPGCRAAEFAFYDTRRPYEVACAVGQERPTRVMTFMFPPSLLPLSRAAGSAS